MYLKKVFFTYDELDLRMFFFLSLSECVYTCVGSQWFHATPGNVKGLYVCLTVINTDVSLISDVGGCLLQCCSITRLLLFLTLSPDILCANTHTHTLCHRQHEGGCAQKIVQLVCWETFWSE